MNEDIQLITSQFEALKTFEGKSMPKPNFLGISEHVFSYGNAYVSRQSNTSNGSNDGASSRESSFLRRLQGWTSQATLPERSIDMHALVSKEVLQYNLEERNAVYEEIHGVRSLCPDESAPGMLDNALEQLAEELFKLPQKQKRAYAQSQQYNDTYVNEPDFRLRFLRAELFDAKKAALRMARFLEVCVEFFGVDKLRSPIRLTDFSRKEMKVFNMGRIQLLPYRDRSGRRIVVGIPSHDHVRQEARIRGKIHFYLWLVASESVESQRRGIVFVTIQNPSLSDSTTTGSTSSNHGENFSDLQEQSKLPSIEFLKLSMAHRQALPIRMSACHLCTPDTPFYGVFQSLITAVMTGDRCRVKVHVGHDVENRYQLNGYGIPLDQLPITESGKIKTTYFKKWIQFRKNLEDPKSDFCQSKLSIVECPGVADVVFRPSQSMMCHPGNVTFRSLVESEHYKHNVATTRGEKAQITNGVIQEIRNLGGRFLVWDNRNFWVELTNEKQIYSKSATFFRNSKISAIAKINRRKVQNWTYDFAGGDGKRRKTDSDEESFSGSCTSLKICRL